jgi:hypothetical protein
MEIDFGSLWTWTLPLWGLFVIILFLGGVIMKPVILEGIGSSVLSMTSATGGAGAAADTIIDMAGGGGKGKSKKVRFAL